MDDVLFCPVCGNRLRNINTDRYLQILDKETSFIERTCTQGQNHSLRFFVDGMTGKVDLLKVSLNPQYTRFIRINYIKQKCRISCLVRGVAEYIEINKLLEPDFPDLSKLKERVSLFVIFS